MNNQEYKEYKDHKLLMLMAIALSFFLLVLKQVNAVLVVTISEIRAPNCVFLMLWKYLNVKVFNLVSGTNETRYIEWHEMCKCKCRFNSSFHNNKQRWNVDKCKCKCKKLIDKGVCYKNLFRILVIENVNVINSLILVTI